MKKLFALLAVVLAVVSCQRDANDLNVAMGGEQEVMLTVSLPEATRADSAQGFDFSSLANTDYTLRYILEVYRVTESGVLYDTCQRFVEPSKNTSMVFPVRLAPGYDYRIVAWTDIVEGDSKEDRYYYTEEGLDNVVIKDNGTVNWNAMDETRDAYTGTQLVENFNSTTNIPNMTLTRPFAKVRVVATDIEDIRNVGLEPTIATVEYAQDMYVKYNAVEDICIADGAKKKKHEYTYATTASKYEDDDNDGELTLFTDYIFVPALRTAKFTLNVYADANKSMLIKGNNFNTDIFVERNKLTTIKGDVLTTGGNIKVTVDNELGVKETYTYVDTAEDLQDKINNAADDKETNISLGGNIDLSDLLNAGTLSTRAAQTAGLVIPAGKSVVLDLNGYTISQTKEQTGAYAMIDNKGSLTIEDSSENKSGKIAYGDNGNGGNYVSNTISNSGVLTINGGTIENNSSATVASNGYPHPIDNSGVLTINGGTFTNNANYSSMRIWCTTDDDTIVTIDGGTFNGSIDFHNPSAAANKGTLTINGGTFNADTYTNCSVRLLGFGADVDEMNGYIKGGHFNSAIILKKYYTTDDVFNSKVFDITGGTFAIDPSEFVNDNYAVVENNGIYSLELKPVIAKIGEVEYRSLQYAFNDVDNGEITLLADATINKPIVLADGKTATLNLNGKTITASEYAIENYGTLTINGNGTINGIVYAENGDTTIENGTYNAVENGAYVFLNSEAGTLTINGGTINACTTYPIYSYNNGNKLIINNVTINGTFGCVNAYGENGSVEINGGIFKMTGVQGNTSHITYFSSKITATINGGTFEKVGDLSMSSTGGGGICVNGGANLTIKGGSFSGDYADVYNYGGTISIEGGSYKFEPTKSFIAENHKVIEANGRWSVVVDPVAKIGDTEYATLEAAVAAAKAGDTIILNKDVTLSEELEIPADVTLNGNGKQINGSIYAGGDLTFAGHTKVTAFSASYYDRVITIGEDACLEVTGGGRVSLAYGNTFKITGNIQDAKSADKANIQPSLIIPGGISITGGNNAAMNVTNAYVKIGSTTSKPGVANGEFTLNFKNAIVEFTKEFGFYEPTGGVAPEFVMNIKDSVFTTGTKLCIAAANSTVNVDNSVVALGDYLRNSGNLNLINGSVFTGRTIQFGENGGNNGAITVDNSSFTIVAGSTGSAFDGKGIGSITAQNGATVAVDYYKDMTISVDGTSTFTGTEVK